jgi:hypothetical protein
MEHRLIGNNKKNSNYIKLGKEEELKSWQVERRTTWRRSSTGLSSLLLKNNKMRIFRRNLRPVLAVTTLKQLKKPSLLQMILCMVWVLTLDNAHEILSGSKSDSIGSCWITNIILIQRSPSEGINSQELTKIIKWCFNTINKKNMLISVR